MKFYRMDWPDELVPLYCWWTVMWWKWGVKLGPVTVEVWRAYRETPAGFAISLFGRWSLDSWA